MIYSISSLLLQLLKLTWEKGLPSLQLQHYGVEPPQLMSEAADYPLNSSNNKEN